MRTEVKTSVSVLVLEVELKLSSGEASPTIWSCYANISVFINRENNQFLKKLMNNDNDLKFASHYQIVGLASPLHFIIAHQCSCTLGGCYKCQHLAC
jgi:hypothetical protein